MAAQRQPCLNHRAAALWLQTEPMDAGIFIMSMTVRIIAAGLSAVTGHMISFQIALRRRSHGQGMKNFNWSIRAGFFFFIGSHYLTGIINMQQAFTYRRLQLTPF